MPTTTGEPRTEMLDSEKLQDNQESLGQFVQELIAAQPSLRAYILASIGGSGHEAADVLQKTNLALWKNAGKFRVGTPFMPWAVTLAKYEVLAYCRDKARDRHIFPEDVAELMGAAASEMVEGLADRIEALKSCLGTITQRQRDLLAKRYFDGSSIAQIAAGMQRSDSAVKSALARVRKALQACIDHRLRTSANTP
jgi:RNA polymerase sigma-70 factor, ECF subfamily